MARLLPSLFLLSLTVKMAFSFLNPQPTCGETAAETTTQSSESTTLGYYEQYWQGNGWKTDDAGNVFVGDDNAKLLLIQQGSYCPVAICKGWFGIW
ncbi:unnamed protein product [Caenorhabditis sp. 36 PRJEB53466]|nr:unnamed protein product [Caenorhabditis sp. 36 PRJEB53466]